MNISSLPALNAVLNCTATVLIVTGWFHIRAGRRDAHRKTMLAAVATSTLFLASYLYYHLVVQAETGPVGYNGVGWRRGAYLTLLLTHVLGAIVNLPMVLLTLWRAKQKDWERHRRIARWTWPIWFYVSVTGVLVYLALYHWNPPVE